MTADSERRWRPLAGFFALACAGSWTCWTLAAVAAPSAPRLAEVLDLGASYGPALAALVMTGRWVSPSGAHRVARAVGALAVLVLSVWALSGQWRAALDAPADWGMAALVVPTLLPAVVTYFYRPTRAASAAGGVSPDVRRSGGHRLRGQLAWLAVALLLFPVTSVVGLTVVGALAGSPTTWAGGTAWSGDATGLVGVFAATALYGGPLGEEPGWRGFALPHLESAVSPLLGSVVVGIGWAAWHLPLQLRGTYEGSMGAGLQGVALRFASQVAVSVIFTWIYNHTKGSLLAVVVLHTSLNNTAGYWLPSSIGFQVGVGVLATALVLVERMYRPPGLGRSRRGSESARRP